MAQTSIITGQYVCIRQPAATVMQRFVAWIIDYSIMSFTSFMLISLMSALAQLNSEVALAIYMVGQVGVLTYPLLMEVFYNGQSIGKQAAGIKVAKLDGSKPTVGAYLIRWVMLLIDMGMGFVGLTFIIFTKNSQRIGDLAAGTTVVKANRQHRSISFYDLTYTNSNYQPSYPEAANLSVKQFNVIANTLYNHNNQMRDIDISMLGDKVQQVLGVHARENSPEAFLYTIFNDFQYYTSKAV